MTSHAKRPILSAFQTSSTWPAHYKSFFSSNTPRWAKSASAFVGRRQKAERSMKVMVKEQNKWPTDMGLVDGTFIMPTGANKPSLFTDPRGRLKLEWTRLNKYGWDLASLWAYMRITKPRKKLLLRQTAPTAIELHRKMYTAFAEGDISTLRKICAEGILESFRKRIAARAGEKWEWNLESYRRTPRVVSNRAVKLPLDKAGLRQAVVNIESRQSLTRTRPDGTRVPGTGTQKVVREYVVIQKQMFDGVENRWLVWGTTEETTLSKLAAQEKKDL
ncbi:MAG: hypothetical protein M1812_005728 [Candelaria pacifica]|nr:MAG: hypothetical protein M1812_005728 [Candelaria pacifica]